MHVALVIRTAHVREQRQQGRREVGYKSLRWTWKRKGMLKEWLNASPDACGAVRAKGTLYFSVRAHRQILSSETLWNHFKLENSGSRRQTSVTWTEMRIKAETDTAATEWTDSNRLVCTYTLRAPPIKRTSPDMRWGRLLKNTNTCSRQQKWATEWFKWIFCWQLVFY